jgi:hypothetical protein
MCPRLQQTFDELYVLLVPAGNSCHGAGYNQFPVMGQKLEKRPSVDLGKFTREFNQHALVFLKDQWRIMENKQFLRGYRATHAEFCAAAPRRKCPTQRRSCRGQFSSRAADSGNSLLNVVPCQPCEARLTPGLANQAVELLPRGRRQSLKYEHVILSYHDGLCSRFKPELFANPLRDHHLASRRHSGGNRRHDLTNKILSNFSQTVALGRALPGLNWWRPAV